jgi:hypothetical protein
MIGQNLYKHPRFQVNVPNSTCRKKHMDSFELAFQVMIKNNEINTDNRYTKWKKIPHN